MKNEPAQNLEMKDFSPAVGTRPLILRRAFGTARWRPVVQATSTSRHAEDGSANLMRSASAEGHTQRFRRCEARRSTIQALSSSTVRGQASSAGTPINQTALSRQIHRRAIAACRFAAHDSSCCSEVCERRVGAPYFTAPKRLSNEFDGTIGAEPATSCPWRQGPAVSDTDGFSGGRRGGLLGVGASAPWSSARRFGPRRRGSLGLGRLRLRRRRAGGGVAAPPRPTLRARLEKNPSFWPPAPHWRRGSAPRRGPAPALRQASAVPARPSADCPERRRRAGGLTWEGMVPGAPRHQRQALAVAAFRKAGVAVGHAGGEHPVHAAVDAGVDPRDRRSLRDQLGGLGRSSLPAFRARRRRCPRRSRRPGIWPRRRTPDRAWRPAP